MRFPAFAQRFVVDDRGLGAERGRYPAAERPFATVAILRADVAVDVQPAVVIGGVVALRLDLVVASPICATSARAVRG